jgi:hypothetical protein
MNMNKNRQCSSLSTDQLEGILKTLISCVTPQCENFVSEKDVISH